jgi:hypothetical protein
MLAPDRLSLYWPQHRGRHRGATRSRDLNFAGAASPTPVAASSMRPLNRRERDLHPRCIRLCTHLRRRRAPFKGLLNPSLSTTQKYTHASIRQLMDIYDKSHPHA